VNNNPLKIFKNQVNFSTRLGKHLYYETIDEKNEFHCDHCKARYVVKGQRYAPCQKAEVLPLSGGRKVITLNSNISTLWLIEPFVNLLEIGDVISLTAYYFMCPQQQIEKTTERCVSPFLGSFVAFDIVKVNPFNQMIGRDVALAKLFYADQTISTTTSQRGSKGLMLTLENIKMHD
jgi:hypothetical protein